MAAGQALLVETGSESGVSIRAVTKRAGVAPQSFYLQFSSLDDLFFALYKVAFSSLQAQLVAAGEGAGDPVARLSAISGAYIGFALENPGPYRALLGSQGVLHGDWDVERLPGADTFALLRSAVAGVGAVAVEDPRVLHVEASLLWTQLHGIAILMINRPTFSWPTVDDLVDRLVGRIVRQPAKPNPGESRTARLT